MGMDPVSWGMLATSGFQAWNQYEAGSEAKTAYNLQAREVENRTAYQQRLALEEMKDITAAGQAEQSKLRATAGGSGLRVAGSVATMSQVINQQVARRKAMIGYQFNEQARENKFEADMLRWQGKRVYRAGMLKAGESLLTGGLMLADRKKDLGTSWGGLFSTRTRERERMWKNQQSLVRPAH